MWFHVFLFGFQELFKYWFLFSFVFSFKEAFGGWLYTCFLLVVAVG